jgi:hypothetical protein
MTPQDGFIGRNEVLAVIELVRWRDEIRVEFKESKCLLPLSKQYLSQRHTRTPAWKS